MKTLIICLFVAVFGLSSCEVDKTQPLGKEETHVSNENKNENNDEGKNDDVIDNGEDREIDPFILSLQGTWHTHTMVYYDEEWKEVIEVLVEDGCEVGEWSSHINYIFNADGTITYQRVSCGPFEPEERTCPCFYDSESKIITVKDDNDEVLREYLVSDYDGEYLTLDYKETIFNDESGYTLKCVREMLKRRQE